jgi:alpha-glucoside transport system permease protein
VLVVYPIFFTIVRSLYSASGNDFVGVSNYLDMFTDPNTLIAIRNNAIWVAVAPTIVTVIGLIFAVLTERIKFATAFKVVIFMPMAISFLSAGVIWRLVYEQNPNIGLANATAVAVAGVFRPPGPYPDARSSQPEQLQREGYAFITTSDFVPGDSVMLGIVGLPQAEVPEDAVQAVAAQSQAEMITGTVWLDFAPGGGGQQGVIDERERGLPGIEVEALAGGEVAGSGSTEPDGTFAIEGLEPGTRYQLRLSESNFRPPFGGFSWLGPTLVTPAVIVSYIWIWAGFAMVLIAAGLAAIPRDVLEAARVDGATEWQVFRRVTVPLLAPVLLVVLVTLVINVLKVFDLVLVIPPESTQFNANVIALQMWRVSFGGAQNHGLGSALAVFLFLLVIPAMVFNIRRFRSEQ